MSRAKIAPTLQAVAAGWLIMPDLTKCPAALTELRALLAVARAAGPAVEAIRKMLPGWARREEIERFAKAEARLRRAAPRGNRRTRR